MHLVRLAGCSFLWATQTNLSHHRRLLSTTIDVFEQSIEEKKLLYKQRHNKVILQWDNARPHVAKWVKTYLGMLEWEVFTRHCPIWLLLVLINGIWPGWAALLFLWRCQKWVDLGLALKDVIFLTWNSNAARKMRKSTSKQWTTLSVICFLLFLKIKHFLMKN